MCSSDHRWASEIYSTFTYMYSRCMNFFKEGVTLPQLSNYTANDWVNYTVEFNSNWHPSVTVTCLTKFYFHHLALEAVDIVKILSVVAVEFVHSGTIWCQIHSGYAARAKINHWLAETPNFRPELPYLVGCHMSQFRPFISTLLWTCDNDHISARQVLTVMHDWRIDLNSTVICLVIQDSSDSVTPSFWKNSGIYNTYM